MDRYIPKRGERFTISTNKITGDRSGTDSIMECVETNDITLFAKRLTGLMSERFPDMALVLSEHDFSPVSEFTLRRFQGVIDSAPKP